MQNLIGLPTAFWQVLPYGMWNEKLRIFHSFQHPDNASKHTRKAYFRPLSFENSLEKKVQLWEEIYTQSMPFWEWYTRLSVHTNQTFHAWTKINASNIGLDTTRSNTRNSTIKLTYSTRNTSAIGILKQYINFLVFKLTIISSPWKQRSLWSKRSWRTRENNPTFLISRWPILRGAWKRKEATFRKGIYTV